MKKSSVLTLALCAAFVLSVGISNAADDAKPKGDREARRAKMLKEYDKDGDGKLDETEREAMKKDQGEKRGKKKDAPAPAAK